MSTPVYATPEEAEAAFYRAFEQANIDAMMGVWADDDAIVCVHPMGSRLLGREAIAASWRAIFTNSPPLRFDIQNIHRVRGAVLSLHSLHESIHYGARLEQRSLVLATNVYRLADQGWQIILHHASTSTSEASMAPSPKRAIH